jgi:hypothetical protein
MRIGAASSDIRSVAGFVYVGFEALTPMVAKIPTFWNITPCIPLKINRRCGATCPIFRVDKRTSAFTFVSCLAYSSTLKIEAICPSDTSLTLNELNGRISQETEPLNRCGCPRPQYMNMRYCIKTQFSVTTNS